MSEESIKNRCVIPALSTHESRFSLDTSLVPRSFSPYSRSGLWYWSNAPQFPSSTSVSSLSTFSLMESSPSTPVEGRYGSGCLGGVHRSKGRAIGTTSRKKQIKTAKKSLRALTYSGFRKGTPYRARPAGPWCRAHPLRTCRTTLVPVWLFCLF